MYLKTQHNQTNYIHEQKQKYILKINIVFNIETVYR